MGKAAILLTAAAVVGSIPVHGDAVTNQASATAQSVMMGEVTSAGPGTPDWRALRTNMKIAPGAEVRMTASGRAAISINGASSVLRLGPEADLKFLKMEVVSSPTETSRVTHLKLTNGNLAGTVRAQHGEDEFRIEAGSATASILEGDFEASVADGVGSFACVHGEMVCWNGGSARTLHTGESWTPGQGANPAAAPPAGGQTVPTREMMRAQGLASSYDGFGCALFHAIDPADTKANVFFSPLCVGMALAMLQDGATGATEKEIATALRVQGIAPEELDTENNLLLKAVPRAGEAQLEIANSLWANQRAPIRSGFVAQVTNAYEAEAANVDFASDGADRINEWARARTHGKIANLVDRLSEDDRLVMANAVYFKGQWEQRFNKELTAQEPFTLESGAKVMLPRMQVGGPFRYGKTRDFQIVALPYHGGVTMYVLLPREPLSEFARNMAAQDWNKWMGMMTERDGTVELPRFKLETSYDLVPALKELGIKSVFEANAELPRIAENVFVSAALHRTYLSVDEEGTVSLAAIGEFATASAPVNKPPPFEMIVDRPFLVEIREDRTGLVLFLGAIRDPR